VFVTVSIRASTPADLGVIRALLEASSLPVADVTPSAAVEFLVAVESGQPVGAVGIERFGSTGLLRSLVVAPSRRGAGLGVALVDALERHAAQLGIERLVLLTTSEEAFFAARGYAAAERATLPGDVLESAQFRTLCPTSARCLARQLRAPGGR